MSSTTSTLPPMGLPQPKKRYTPEEYYELERAAEFKSDYLNGEIFATGEVLAMSGGTAPHSRICSNLLREVGTRLKGTTCVEYESNLRLKVTATGFRAYPDASVYCGPLERDEEDRHGETYVNPTVLFEVLSKSTEGYDRGTKAENYRLIESLKAYVFVSQHHPHIEISERHPDGSWRMRDFNGLQATLPLEAIGITLPLSEIYDRVDFASAETAT